MTISAPSTLLLGPSGSGKTSALATFLLSGIETFVIVTEPNGTDTLIDSAKRLNADLSKLHWHTVLPAPAGWSALLNMATTIKAMDFESIAKIKSGVDKGAMMAIPQLLGVCQNFHCERDGQDYGDVTTWDDKRAFVIDSLSGLSLMTWLMTVGYKPSAHQGEWGIAMNFIEQLLLKFTSDIKCFFVVTSHVERELDELTGGSKIMASTLGRKLAPKIPRFFSEVPLARRNPDKTFLWSTVDVSADLKNRALKIDNNLPPSFAPIVDAHRLRLNQVATTKPQSSAT
jgi:hypothetical protein